MRVTTRQTTRNYIEGFNRAATRKERSYMSMLTGQKFLRASEDPINASKALKTRKALRDNDVYASNLNTAQNIYKTADDALQGVQANLKLVYEKLVGIANGTNSATEDTITHVELDKIAEEMVGTMNLTMSPRRLFGGTNNASQAFEIRDNTDGTRDLYYNGVPINKYADASMYPNSNPSYTDIGIGMRLNDKGDIDPQSALQMTFNGAEILGCGLDTNVYAFNPDTALEAGKHYYLTITFQGKEKNIDFKPTTKGDLTELSNAIDAEFGTGNIKVGEGGIIYVNKSTSDPTFRVKNTEYASGSYPSDYTKLEAEQLESGYSHNLIQLVLDVSNLLRTSDNGHDITSQIDKKYVARYADILFREQTTLLKSLTRIGSNEQYIEFHLGRIESNNTSLTEYDDSLESTDLAEESMNFSIYEAGYNMALQLASKVIPQSIWSFM